ncbi:MAG: hypothetical protein ACFCD0_01065 [Gemmataceae bacterium]
MFLKDYGTTMGPIGVPMTDEQARQLDAILKNLDEIEYHRMPVEKGHDGPAPRRTRRHQLDHDRIARPTSRHRSRRRHGRFALPRQPHRHTRTSILIATRRSIRVANASHRE